MTQTLPSPSTPSAPAAAPDSPDLLAANRAGQPAPATESNEILDQLVQDHLSRGRVLPSTQTPADKNIPAPAPPNSTPAAVAPVPRDLQAEIAALLGATSSATLHDAPLPNAGTTRRVESLAAPPKDMPPAVNAQELDALLSAPTHVDLTPPPEETKTPATLAPAADLDAQVAQAKTIAAAELQQLQVNAATATATAVPPAPAAAAPTSETTPSPATASAATAFTPPAPASASAPAAPAPETPLTETQGVGREESSALQAEVPTPASPPPAARRLTAFVHDFLLLFAQILDMPFAWLPDAGKQLIGVAAIASLLAGVALLLVAHFRG